MRIGLLIAVVFLLGSPSGHGQVRKPSAATKGNELCVDVATLRQGKPVRGLVVGGDGSSNSPWLMAVERSVYEADHPSSTAQATKVEFQKAVQAIRDLQTRIESELKQPDLNPAYKNFLSDEQQRIAALPWATTPDTGQASQASKTRFMWLELTNKECSAIRRAPAEAQRVAVWAWSEKLTGVHQRDRADLERELVQANIDVKLKLPDLSKELPPRPESEELWQARLAIVRYTMAGGVDFQGSNGVYVRAGSGQAAGAADIGPLIQKMMGGSIESLLQELDPTSKSQAKSNSSDWFRSVVSPAEELGRREFRITRLDQDPSGQAASVETALVAKLPQRGWQIVWSSKQTRQAAEVTAQAEQQISQDPQVKTALSLLAALGAGADAEIKKAIRYGAATMAAQAAADSEFLKLRDRFTNRLDGPPMN